MKWWLLEKPVRKKRKIDSLGPFPTDAASQLDVLGHDGHTLGVNGAQVSVLKEPNQIGLTGLLQSSHCRALEAEVGLKVLGDLTDQTLEGQFADQQLGGLLVATDLTQSHGTRLVTVGLLHSAGGRGTFAGSLGCQLLARGLPSSGLASSLLGTSHCFSRESFEPEIGRAHV